MSKKKKKTQVSQPKQQKKDYLIPILCLILAVVAIDLLIYRNKTPRFVPPAFAENAAAGTPNVPEGMGYTELYQDGMAYRIQICGIPGIEGEALVVYFTNAEENEPYLKLRVLDSDDKILGETGLIRPGEYIRAVTLTKAIQPGTDVKLKIMSYDPETYESVGSVRLNVTVQERTDE